MKTDRLIGTDSATLLRFIQGLFRLSIEISGTPLGPKLGQLDLPGNIGQFINVDARLAGVIVLVYGHIALV